MAPLLLGEDEEEAGELGYDRLIMPKLTVSMDASDDFLRERVINLPEIVVVGTHNTDEAFSRRLNDYRAINTDEDTVLNYFDELEFHPERIGFLPCYSPSAASPAGIPPGSLGLSGL